MKEKTREPIPMVVLEHSQNHRLFIYALDEGDAMASNTSTNYDHHMSGPSLVFKSHRPSGATEIDEYYVNDFDQWHYIDKMIQLGMKYLEENPDFDIQKFDEQIKERRAKYKPHVSHHKNKD